MVLIITTALVVGLADKGQQRADTPISRVRPPMAKPISNTRQ
ncbi:hypothetical protein ACU4HD_25205 [Cupriavidus basilensis]